MAGAPAIMEAEQRLVSENSRLLYVGMTRARDYLVWAFAGKSVKDLDVLSDGDGVPVFQWPTLGATEMVVGGARHSVVQKDLVYEEVVGQTQDMPSTIWVLPKAKRHGAGFLVISLLAIRYQTKSMAASKKRWRWETEFL